MAGVMVQWKLQVVPLTSQSHLGYLDISHTKTRQVPSRSSKSSSSCCVAILDHSIVHQNLSGIKQISIAPVIGGPSTEDQEKRWDNR